MARIIVVIAAKNPRMYLYVLALDNLIVGFIFMASLLFKRSLMQMFADSANAQIPQEILRSAYYGGAWRIVTFAWALTYILFALALVLLKASNLKIVGLIDMLASWPLMVVLFIFTLKFPGWYWKKNYAKIEAGKQLILTGAISADTQERLNRDLFPGGPEAFRKFGNENWQKIIAKEKN